MLFRGKKGENKHARIGHSAVTGYTGISFYRSMTVVHLNDRLMNTTSTKWENILRYMYKAVARVLSHINKSYAWFDSFIMQLL